MQISCLKVLGSTKKRRQKSCKSWRWWIAPRKQCPLGKNRADTHMNSERLWHHTQDLHRFRLMKIQYREEAETKSQTSLISFCNLDLLGKRGNQLFSNDMKLDISTRLQAGLGMVGQHKTSSTVLCALGFIFIRLPFFVLRVLFSSF